jgi:hypothetical protein
MEMIALETIVKLHHRGHGLFGWCSECGSPSRYWDDAEHRPRPPPPPPRPPPPPDYPDRDELPDPPRSHPCRAERTGAGFHGAS